MLNEIKYLVTRSPLENYSALRKKFKGLDWDYSEEILRSKKHMNHQSLIDRWERYLRVIKINEGHFYNKFDFNEKHVLELGCGPLFGWGPIALFRGASMYYFHEPSLMLDVVRSNEVKERYFIPLYQELCSNFGGIMSFVKWYDAVMTKCIHIDFSLEEQVDLVLSNSVIEHLPRSDIVDVFSKLFVVCKSGGYFLHAVDFGAHSKGGAEFGSMYKRQRKTDFYGLNLFRMSDVSKMLVDSQFQLLNSIVYYSSKVDVDLIHPSWRHYSSEDLTSRVVLIIGNKVKNNKL